EGVAEDDLAGVEVGILVRQRGSVGGGGRRFARRGDGEVHAADEGGVVDAGVLVERRDRATDRARRLLQESGAVDDARDLTVAGLGIAGGPRDDDARQAAEGVLVLGRAADGAGRAEGVL